MKKETSHNRPTRSWPTIGPREAGPRLLHAKLIHNRNGSILIWSVMLGFILTSVFFFFSMRQRSTVTAQRDTAEILNARNFLESFADYLEKHPSELSAAYDTNLKQTPDGSIQVSLSKLTAKIEDEVDFGAENVYKFADDILIEWNECNNSRGDLLLNGVLYELYNPVTTCDSYYDVIGPITVTDPFRIKTLNQPFKYRITSNTGQMLTDNKWQLYLKMDLDYGRVVEVSRTFK